MNDNLNCFKAYYFIEDNNYVDSDIRTDFILVDNKLRKSFDDIFETTPCEEDFFIWFKLVNTDLNNIPSKQEVIDYFNEIYK